MNYTITDKEFQCFSNLIYQQSGIALSGGKKALLVSRLSRRLQELGLKTFHAYYERVAGEPSDCEFTRMLDLVSTNKTDFFREPRHFEFLRNQILPELQHIKKIRIWSAGCSSGEEPYTIAIAIHDALISPSQWDCKILASDISTRVLAKATSGIYDLERVRDLPGEVIRRNFMREKGERLDTIRVKPHISDMVIFRRINLMDERYPIKSRLDVIFCRNVMIYFDRTVQERLLCKFHRYLKPGGYLFIGHSETLQLGQQHQFYYVEPTVYRKDT